MGQTPDASDVNDCKIILDAMLAQWNRKRWLIWHLVEATKVTNGSASYTVGAGGDFNVPRPDCIEAAFTRNLNGGQNSVDVPLTIIDAQEDYALLAAKSIQGFPSVLFYDSGYPLGHIHLYPVPNNSQYEIHILVKDTIATSPSLTVDLGLPPEYTDALIWNLSCRIRPLFGLPPDPSLIALAKTALDVIRASNAQLPRLQMPAGIGWSGGGRWAGHGIPGWGVPG